MAAHRYSRNNSELRYLQIIFDLCDLRAKSHDRILFKQKSCLSEKMNESGGKRNSWWITCFLQAGQKKMNINYAAN